jgi:hypothetical protein
VLWFGEELESRVDVGPGDFLYIPPDVPHVPANASDTEWARGVVARTDPNEQERGASSSPGWPAPIWCSGAPPISRRVGYLAPVGDARLPEGLPV